MLVIALSFALAIMPLLTPNVAPSAADVREIAEAQAIARAVGDTLWKGWSRTPFVVDLLTPKYEILLDTSATPPGFTRRPNGDAYRLRTFPPRLEATFPAFDTAPIVVIGEQPLTMPRSPTHWIVTLLHEHFHQWQDSWSQYLGAVGALGLAHGDESGMWMLNYAFPYGSPRTDARFKNLTTHLSAALQAAGTPRFGRALRAYVDARAAWRASLNPNDYRYFAFQCWQEGAALYTEYRVAQSAAKAHDSDPSFLTNSQARLLRQDGRATYASILRDLKAASLRNDRRASFYPVGAAEALLLDRISNDWRARYLDPRMDLGAFL